MKKIPLLAGWLLFILLTGITAFAQDNPTERAVVPFSDPSRPGTVKASTFRGSISVMGYTGKEVVVEASPETHLLTEERHEKEKAKGMQLIQSRATGLTITEEDNTVNVSVESIKRAVSLKIQVPYTTSLLLSAFSGGDVAVERVKGEIEVKNHNGSINLTHVSGAVVASTFNGEIILTLDEIDSGKPMSFSTWNGDIDVTFPASIKANCKMSSQQGDIYSDFDINLTTTPSKTETPKEEKGKYRISFDRTVYGTINGGGPEYQFKSFNGDIFIRKAK